MLLFIANEVFPDLMVIPAAMAGPVNAVPGLRLVMPYILLFFIVVLIPLACEIPLTIIAVETVPVLAILLIRFPEMVDVLPEGRIIPAVPISAFDIVAFALFVV